MNRHSRLVFACLVLLLSSGCIEQPPVPVTRQAADPAGSLPPAQRVPPSERVQDPAQPAAAGRGSSAAAEPKFAPLPRSKPLASGRGGTPTQPAAAAVPTALSVVSVQPGDTVFTIARRNQVPLRDLLEANQLSPPYVLVTGQPLAVPGANVHAVRRGETLYGISRLYNTDVYTLAQSNGIGAPYRLVVGQRLNIPRQFRTPMSPPVMTAQESGAAAPVAGADPPAATATQPAAAEAEPAAATPPPRAAVAGTQVAGPGPAPGVPATGPGPALQRAVIPAPPPRAARSFAWPARGRILSQYGAKSGGLHNDGINIALEPGTPVRAAENGVVVYAGNELRGYGNLLLIRHSDNWMTAYAHAEELLVRRGDTVTRGQTVARAGASGNVRTPQLHFELRRGSQAVDPLQHLTPGNAAASQPVSAEAAPGGLPDPG